MDDEQVRYDFKAEVVLRGTEARVFALMQTEGWELVREKPGLLRTQLMFRRPRPTTAGGHLAHAWTMLRTRPEAQGAVGLVGVMIVCVIVIAVGTAMEARGEGGPGASGGGGGGGVAPAAAMSTASPPATATPTAVPVRDVADRKQEPEPILTKSNSKDLARLLSLQDPEDEFVSTFAQKYQGRTIAFNGNLAYVTNADDVAAKECDVMSSSACDLLIGAGDYSETHSSGPNFKVSDASPNELHLTGSNVPHAITIGQNVRVVARIGGYDQGQTLFRLAPERIRLR